MPRGRSVVKLLLDSSKAALFAGIEIHNKPHIDYRYPTTAILLINAWELALKAYIYKYISKRKIYEKDGTHTIGIKNALNIVESDICSTGGNKNFKAISENIKQLNEYRCANIHYIENSLDIPTFMLMSKAVLNYDWFVKQYFSKDITKDDNLILMPIGFKLPINPIEYLKQEYPKQQNSFVQQIISATQDLYNEGINDSIVVGFDLSLNRIRDISNADIIAALTSESDVTKLQRSFRPTDDPNAPAMRIEPDMLPLRYSDVRRKAKEKLPSIKFNKIFNEAMKIIKANQSLCQIRYLDSANKAGAMICSYSEQAVDEVVKLYIELLSE